METMETQDLIIRKAVFEDWEAMYRNVWSQPETARYMQWEVTVGEEAAKDRMRRTMAFQETHGMYCVCEKKSGEAIGYAGVNEWKPGVYEELGIALGPRFVGRGYGKQILQRLLVYAAAHGGREFLYRTRKENIPSRALALSCGFAYRCDETHGRDRKTGRPYSLEVYWRPLEDMAQEAVAKQ